MIALARFPEQQVFLAGHDLANELSYRDLNEGDSDAYAS
jgi:hypothetical protein